jgi:hypothetical protein
MRHIATLIAAVFIGPLAWILIAFGQDRSAAAFAKAQSSGAFDTGDFVRPLIYLVAAGILVGLIATLRISPLGAVLTGVVYVLSYVWLLVDPKGMLDLFKRNLSIFGQTADPTLPVRTGTTLIIGALLLVAVVSVKRWRRWPQPSTGTGEVTGDPAETTPSGFGDFGQFGTGLGSGTDLGGGFATGLGSSTDLGGGSGTSQFGKGLGSGGDLGGSGLGEPSASDTKDDRGTTTPTLAGRIGTISPTSAPIQRTDSLTEPSRPGAQASSPARDASPNIEWRTDTSSGPSQPGAAGSPWSTPLRETRDDPAR